jgi:mannosyltransferase OCH1-like enzyme
MKKSRRNRRKQQIRRQSRYRNSKQERKRSSNYKQEQMKRKNSSKQRKRKQLLYRSVNEVGSNQEIPKTIMQTGRFHSDMNHCSLMWQSENEDYQYIFFDDEACISYLKRYFPDEVVQSFHTLVPGAFKADLFRYAFLYRQGGVYADLDTQPLCRLTEILPKGFEFVSASERFDIQGVHTSFIACVPGCPFLYRCIERIVHNCKHEYYPKPYPYNELEITGPILLSSALNSICKPGQYVCDGKRCLLHEFSKEGIIRSHKPLINFKIPNFPSSNYRESVQMRRVYHPKAS